MLKIGIVANEVSGDILGAGLIREIKKLVPDVQFEGVAGPLMLAEGCVTLVEMERLSVMGLIEVLKHLPALMGIRKHLRKHFLANPPDLFIGIDAPDFNLRLESDLKQANIPTVHYICPTVWAWRPGRVKKIRAAADLVLSIFPFEPEFLAKHQVKAQFIGHMLADEIPLKSNHAIARETINLNKDAIVVALLPGSRLSEIHNLTQDFLLAAQMLKQNNPNMAFIVPLVNDAVAEAFETIRLKVVPDLVIQTTQAGARGAIAASDLVLCASGTATLEAMLLKRPMVVAYRLNPLTYWIINTFKLLKIPYVSMVNLLAKKALVEEFIQQAVTPTALSEALQRLLDDEQHIDQLKQEFLKIHQNMRCDASAQAAKAVLNLCKKL